MGFRCRHIIDRLAWVPKVPNTIVCRSSVYGVWHMGDLAWSACINFPTFSYIHFCIWNKLSTRCSTQFEPNRSRNKMKTNSNTKKNAFSNENQMQLWTLWKRWKVNWQTFYPIFLANRIEHASHEWIAAIAFNCDCYCSQFIVCNRSSFVFFSSFFRHIFSIIYLFANNISIRRCFSSSIFRIRKISQFFNSA